MNDRSWAAAILEQCLEKGLDHFFVAPGSRCTPLTLAIAENSAAKVVQHFDERGLAFATLGYGRATGKPGIFVCTSGTAVANAYPAVVEAAMDDVPLLLFTADRPDELRGTGANQTIDQRQIFGKYSRLFLNMPVPEDVEGQGVDAFGVVQATIQKITKAAEQGPVHVNWMFREPFTITQTQVDGRSESQTASELDVDWDLLKPVGFDVVSRPFGIHETEVEADQDFHATLKGNVLIALGSCLPEEADEVVKLAVQLGSPILSDITSGLRTGSFELPTEFDLPVPDTILHLGGRILSKSWLQWTQNLQTRAIEFLQLSPAGEFFNPNRLRQRQLRGKLVDLQDKFSCSGTSPSFFSSWQTAIEKRHMAVANYFADSKELSEPAIAHFLHQACPATNGLFVGNSMPIRDMDWYGLDSGEMRRVVANRGVSGIDGLLATATGFATGMEAATTIVLGDLSTLHDLNSLSLVRSSPWPIIVVVINNQGGHIFDLLPIRESSHFERFFATPHRYDFEHGAKMFGLPYLCIHELQEFRDSYREALAASKSIVLEVKTQRQQNLATRLSLREEIRKCSGRV